MPDGRDGMRILCFSQNFAEYRKARKYLLMKALAGRDEIERVIIAEPQVPLYNLLICPRW